MNMIYSVCQSNKSIYLNVFSAGCRIYAHIFEKLRIGFKALSDHLSALTKSGSSDFFNSTKLSDSPLSARFKINNA